MTRQRNYLLQALLTLAVAAFAYQGNAQQASTLTDDERQLVSQNNDFAFSLFRQVRTDTSCVLSPLSVTYALGMLNNGADGQTRQEVCNVLGFANGGQEAINNFCQKLMQRAAANSDDTQIDIACNVFLNSDRGLKLRSDFCSKVLQYYAVTPEERSFADGQTRQAINQWVSDHTNGLIKEMLSQDEFDPDIVSYLLNALYMKGSWSSPFIAEGSLRTFFNGDKATAMMMQQNGEFMYAQNSTFQSIELPYGTRQNYKMTVFLPNRGKTVDDVLQQLNGTTWNADEYKQYMVYLCLPRFKTGTSMRLEQVMAAMGMPNAFAGGEGFNGFCYEGNDETQRHNVCISFMKQAANISVDENGTEASAATAIGTKDGFSPDMPYAEFIADHSFVYVISEQASGAILFIGQYTGDAIDNPRKDIALSEGERQLVKANNDFAFSLFQKARGNESTVLSPLSITYALGMLNNGADGQTRQQICNVLGFGETGQDAINAFCRKMLTEAPLVDKQTKALIANTIFLNQQYQLKPEFVELAQQYYDATPQTRNFGDGETLDAINQWASDHTTGMIPKILTPDEFNADAVSYLMNAIYFKGAWTKPFNPDATVDEPFNGGAAEPMMHRMIRLNYTENDLYQAVRLPYGNEAYSMSIFLPRQGKSIDDVLQALTDDKWRFLSGTYDVQMSMPRFETDASIRLEQVMTDMGMPDAFNPYLADFSGFCQMPTYIALMKQAAKIKVDEQGTEAAAVTIIGNETTGMPETAEFKANRPFLYIISEQSTGAIFFIGQFMGQFTARTEGPQTTGIATPNALYNLNGQRLTTPPARGIYLKNGKKTATTIPNYD